MLKIVGDSLRLCNPLLMAKVSVTCFSILILPIISLYNNLILLIMLIMGLVGLVSQSIYLVARYVGLLRLIKAYVGSSGSFFLFVSSLIDCKQVIHADLSPVKLDCSL